MTGLGKSKPMLTIPLACTRTYLPQQTTSLPNKHATQRLTDRSKSVHSIQFNLTVWGPGHSRETRSTHDDITKWRHFPRYWPFVRGIHRSPVNSPHKGQWRGASMLSLICVWINGVNNREAGDLRRYRAHYDVTVMIWISLQLCKIDTSSSSMC